MGANADNPSRSSLSWLPQIPSLTPACDTRFQRCRIRTARFRFTNEIDRHREEFYRARLRRQVRQAAKPYPEFPLFPTRPAAGRKKIRGKMHYFGPWNAPDGALAKYEAEKEALHSGREPRSDAEAVTVKLLGNAFLNHKAELLEAGDLAPRTAEPCHSPRSICPAVGSTTRGPRPASPAAARSGPKRSRRFVRRSRTGPSRTHRRMRRSRISCS
jgi:hypothetical protein